MDTIRKPVATNRFEELGCKLMENSKNFNEMKKWYDKCCTACCMRRREETDCGGCPIRATMLAVVDAGWHRMKADDYLYIELERASC